MATSITTEINNTTPSLSRTVNIDIIPPFAFTRYTIYLTPPISNEECKRLYIRLPSGAWIIQCTAILDQLPINLSASDKDADTVTYQRDNTNNHVQKNITLSLISNDHYRIDYWGKKLGDKARITVSTCSLMSLWDNQYSYQLPFFLSHKLLTERGQSIPFVNYAAQDIVSGRAVIHSTSATLTSNYKTQYLNHNTMTFYGLLDVKLSIQVTIPEQPQQVAINTGKQLFLLSQIPLADRNNTERSHLNLVMLGSNKVLIKLIITMGLLIRNHLRQYRKNSVISIQVNDGKVYSENCRANESYQSFYRRLISLISLQIEIHTQPLLWHCVDGLITLIKSSVTPTNTILICDTNDTLHDSELDSLRQAMGNTQHLLQVINLQSLILTNPMAMFDDHIVEYALPLPTSEKMAEDFSAQIQGLVSRLFNTSNSAYGSQAYQYSNYKLTEITDPAHQKLLHNWCLKQRNLASKIVASAYAKNYQTTNTQQLTRQKEDKVTSILPCHGFTDRYRNNMEFQLNQLHEDTMLYTQLSSHDLDVHWQYLCSRNRTERKSDLELSIHSMEKNAHNPQLVTIHLMKLTDIIDPLELSYINDIRAQHRGSLSQFIAQWMLVICNIVHIPISATLRVTISDISNGLNGQAKADILSEFGH